MKTVLPAKENIAKLWGHPKPKDTPYRLMKYLLQCEVEEGTLLHNVVTGHLILLTKEEAESLSHLPANQTELTQELIADHFLVPQDFDEYRSVNQLRKILQSRDTGDYINHYVILPTTFCNAHCFYCYESDYPRVHMTEETAAKLIDYISNHHQDKKVLLSWFGGEPLIGIDRIDQISQGLKDRGIPFSASMISNGYLFDVEIVNRCINLWNLERVQITLDGTEEVYNRVKAYVNANGNPFQRVLHNIDLLSERNVQVVIRINSHYYNRDDVSLLIEMLGKRYAGNKKVLVYTSMLYNNQGYEPVQYSLDDYSVILKINDDYTKRLMELSIGNEKRKIPFMQVHQCMADNPHTIMIQPDGGFCRCEHESLLDRYGSIDDGILDERKIVEWKETINRSEHCSECSLYPYCYLLRRCMSVSMPCSKDVQWRILKDNEDFLRIVFKKSVEEIQ